MQNLSNARPGRFKGYEKKQLLWGLYGISIVFILGGAVNAGFSGYAMAIPFMGLALWVSRSKLQSRTAFSLAAALIVAAVFVSHTQTKNPILFPVLSDGYVEILEDGYQETFFDGSGGFTQEKDADVCMGCGEITYTKLTKGDIYQVLGVRLGHPDFGTSISVVTEVGEFSKHDYSPSAGMDAYIKLNKPPRAHWADVVSFSMAWPIAFLAIGPFIHSARTP
ncbi:MAG: hypothetical protein A2408_01495 [Candidatus Yonathbacteria bacterium RIFOXYC1_FULL_52_10]|uniref:DUF4131 domain-containing protein n=1 Tax=Candidatus Yonathbacteria bacterium RIFOXYD1_FULL_52_36 TaxID=1802730 RepID=A0A1G2SM29_9BACT|nr:MAG: hypothetical protein A2408_01495 [Candidatus Yonathbacteria bacterium RIFOXYC1_FULL_52_10]OHA86004.1 MAG: hypothetical protein A2591_02380 [Candidatus Yonathbacteria bacterium RIFOXYD1_FULL_52_36]